MNTSCLVALVVTGGAGIVVIRVRAPHGPVRRFMLMRQRSLLHCACGIPCGQGIGTGAVWTGAVKISAKIDPMATKHFA